MDPFKLILVIMLVSVHLRKVKMEETTDTFYIAEYPDKIRPYSKYVVSVSVPEHIPSKVELAASLMLGEEEVATDPLEVEPGQTATITFDTAKIEVKNCELKIMGQMLEKTSTLMDSINTALNPTLLLVQADKHEYKPGEKIIILSGVLDEFLRPLEVDKLHTFLQSPQKVHVLKNEQTQDGTGLFYSEYILPTDVPSGDWSVVARYKKTLRKSDYFKVSDANSSNVNEHELLNDYILTMKSLIEKLTVSSHSGEKILPDTMKSVSETMEKLEHKIPMLKKISSDPETENSLVTKLQEKEERILLLEKSIAEIRNEKNSTFLVRGLPVLTNEEMTLQQQLSEYLENFLKLKDIPIKSIRSLSSKFSLTSTLRVKVDKPATALKIMTAQSILPENDSGVTITEDDTDYSCEKECDHIFAETKRGFRSKLKNRRGKVSKKTQVTQETKSTTKE